MAAPAVIERTATYFHTRIGRRELDRLFLVAGGGAAPGTVTLKCTVGSTQLTADTLDDLIAARAALPYVSDRTPWTALTFEREEGAAGYIRIRFAQGVVRVTARSTDPIWTHGQVHRLGEVLEEAHGRGWAERFRTTGFGSLFTVGTGVGFLSYLHLNSNRWKPNAYLYGMEIFIVITAVLVAALAMHEWFKLRSIRPVFKVTNEVEWGSAWSRLTNTDRIAFASAVIAGLTLVATAAALI